MASRIEIRRLAEHEWVLYKDLRLAALAESPDAFGSTFAKEAQRSDAEWATRLASGVNSAWDLPIVAGAAHAADLEKRRGLRALPGGRSALLR